MDRHTVLYCFFKRLEGLALRCAGADLCLFAHLFPPILQYCHTGIIKSVIVEVCIPQKSIIQIRIFFFFFKNLVVKYLLAYYWTSLKRRNTSTVIGRNWKEDGWKFTKMYRFNDKKPRCFLFSVRKVARLRLRGQVRCQVFVGKIIITKYNSYNYKESLDDSFYNHIYPWQFIVDHNY